MEFQVTVVTKSDETASGEIKRKPGCKWTGRDEKERNTETHYALVIFSGPGYFEIKFDYCNLLFKTKLYNHE